MDESVLGELGEVEEEAKEFLSSFKKDKWIFEADVKVGKAHTLMLIEKDIIPLEIGKEILRTLEEVEYSDISGEDVHIAIESYLKQELGPKKGGWLHTARSRNDEVATCLRMKVRDEIIEISLLLKNLINTIFKKANENKHKLFPGFTHLQHAEPTTIGHHLASYSQTLLRDLSRLIDSYDRTNKSPLGAGALTTTTFDIDREETANYLGFDGLIENSIDAVYSRDFITETTASLLNLMLTLSNISEEFILWSSQEFSYIGLPDEFTSTSSIMPQKKNPDILELIRAKTSSLQGNLVAISSIIKSQTRSYNRDLQEINPKLWESIDIAKNSISLIDKILAKTEFNDEKIKESLRKDNSEASEMANQLTRQKNISFRESHNKISKMIKEGQKIEDIANKLDLSEDKIRKEKIIKRKQNTGAPSAKSVKELIETQKTRLKDLNNKIKRKKDDRNKKLKKLDQEVKKIIKDNDSE